MGTTSLGLRYPDSTNSVNVPQDIQNLAADVDAKLVTNNQFVTRKDGVQAVASNSPSAGIGTTTTAVLTLTNCVFQQGRAYSIEVIGGLYADVDGRLADISVFKTNTSGTQYAAFYRKRCSTIGKQVDAYSQVYVKHTGTDLTTDIVLTLTADAGTITMDAGAGARPRALVVRDVGLASAYSWCFDVT